MRTKWFSLFVTSCLLLCVFFPFPPPPHFIFVKNNFSRQSGKKKNCFSREWRQLRVCRGHSSHTFIVIISPALLLTSFCFSFSILFLLHFRTLFLLVCMRIFNWFTARPKQAAKWNWVSTLVKNLSRPFGRLILSWSTCEYLDSLQSFYAARSYLS